MFLQRESSIYLPRFPRLSPPSFILYLSPLLCAENVLRTFPFKHRANEDYRAYIDWQKKKNYVEPSLPRDRDRNLHSFVRSKEITVYIFFIAQIFFH